MKNLFYTVNVLDKTIDIKITTFEGSYWIKLTDTIRID